MLIGRLLSAAGNRLTASLKKETVGTSNQFQLKSREYSVVGESNGKSGQKVHGKFWEWLCYKDGILDGRNVYRAPSLENTSRVKVQSTVAELETSWHVCTLGL